MITRTLTFQGVPASRVNQSTVSFSASPSPQVQAYQLAKTDAFTRTQAVKHSEVRFGSPTPISVNLTGVNAAPEVTTKLLSFDPMASATAIRIGNSYENTGIKILSPNADITLIGITNEQIANLATKDDLKAVQRNIIRPLTEQLSEIRSLVSRGQSTNINKGRENLRRASEAKRRSEMRHYLRAAEQDFIAAKSDPINFEHGIEAQIGYSTCLRLLGYTRESQREYYSALCGMAESLPVLEAAARAACSDSRSKAIFKRDLYTIQSLTSDNPKAQNNIFRVGLNILKSSTITSKYLKSRVADKDLTNIKFNDPDALKGAFVLGADFRGSTLKNMNLRGLGFSLANLEGVDLSRSDLREATFHKAKIEKANFSHANMQGVRWFNEFKFGPGGVDADLSYANLSNTDLQGVDFGGMCLDHTNFENSNLTKADLYGARSKSASLDYGSGHSSVTYKAKFRNSNLYKSQFGNQHFIECDFSGADLDSADVSGGTLKDCKVNGTKLGNVVLHHPPLYESLKFRDTDLNTADWGGRVKYVKETENFDGIPCTMVWYSKKARDGYLNRDCVIM